MPRDELHKVQIGKLKGKVIFTCQQCRIIGYVKMNCLNLWDIFPNKSQDLKYKINLVLIQLCIIERKLSKLAGCKKYQEFKNANKTKMKN
jgi:hypothetical protein